MKAMDSEGVSLRATYKLKRGKQICNGSNEIRQLERYYKLKPFLFAKHGCIDSFIRKIIWLCLASTNNDPKVMAWYFVDYLSKLELGPKVIRADRESENIYAAGTQSCCHKWSNFRYKFLFWTLFVRVFNQYSQFRSFVNRLN